MARLLLLGGGILQTPVAEIARELGHQVHCLDARLDPPCRQSGAICHQVDFGHAQKALDFAEKLHSQNTLQGVLTVGTDFSHTVSLIAQKLGLVSHSPQAALSATDKYLMRRTLAQAGVPVPKYALVEKLDSWDKSLDFPLVVKPADSMGARGVVKVTDHEELAQAFTLARKHSQTHRVVIEEFLDGPEYSLDGLVQDGIQELYGIADRQIALEPHFVELGHSFPSLRPTEEQKQVIETFWQGVRALGLSHGGVKGDIKFSRGRAVVGEIAGRLSGGFMSGWSYPFFSGRSAIRGAIQIALGEKLEVVPEQTKQPVYEGALIAPPGKVESVEWRMQLKSAQSFYWLNKQPGDRTLFPINNVQKVGNTILSPPTKRGRPIWQQTDFRRELGLQKVLLDPMDTETLDFFQKENRLLWITVAGKIPPREDLPKTPELVVPSKENLPLTLAPLDLFGNDLISQFSLVLDRWQLLYRELGSQNRHDLWLAYCLGGPSLLLWQYRRQQL